MLNFFPALPPWSYLYADMKSQLPVGSFYLYTTHLLPRSSKPSEFWLVTDRYETVTVSINGKVVGQLNPKSKVQRVYLALYEPPTSNQVRVENGVDAPINLKVVTTHVAKEIEVVARELYQYAGRTVERYSDLISSPWVSFILDYQLPWRQRLPNIRSLRIMSTKMLGNVLFGPGGTNGGVLDLVSAFTSTTPVVTEPKNPAQWQPDVYQPVTSGFDVGGFDFHVWFTNPCLVRWAAFVKLRQNTKTFTFTRIHEDALTLAPLGTTFYEQHLTDNFKAGCSVLDDLLSLGCMDGIVVAGVMHFLSQPSICAYAEPLDLEVVAPGVGGRFFDSGPDFDAPVALDDIYDVDLLTDYWVGTSTVKRFDFGKCLDGYSSGCSLPADANCCTDAPDAVLLQGLDCQSGVVSPVTPNNPLFGGDNPGILMNPYFDLLA
jgi:hypothetical protein